MSAAFIDNLIEKFNLKNDASLCRLIGVDPSQISKVRNGVLPIGNSLLVKILRVKPEMSIADLDKMLKV